MKVIGYGICGPGEADRYMRATMEEFKRLCDTVVILGNNATEKERAMVAEYGFKYVTDRREWGKWQWRIKQDLIERDIKQIAEMGDVLVCLDMDEVFSKKLTKEWLLQSPLDAYHVFIVDLWNDEKHYKAQSCFWNVRIWRWNGETKWKEKPVHCGLAPEWAYFYHRHAPFILKHFGLMKEEDRARKIKRYEQYDPGRKHMASFSTHFYDMLKSNTAIPFDEDRIQDVIEKEVASYKQRKPQQMAPKKKARFAYFKNPHGVVLDIPEKHFEETKRRKGFEFIGWADDQKKEMERLFSGEDVGVAPDAPEAPQGAYHPDVNGFGPDKAFVPSEGEIGRGKAAPETAPLSDDELEKMAVKKGLEGDIVAPLPSPTEEVKIAPKAPKKATPAKGKGSSKKAK